MKNIVNPLPEIFNEPIPVLNGAVWTNENDYEYGRRGVGYDYEVKRNRFIIDAIHTSFLAGRGHISIGYRLSVGESATTYGLTEDNNIVTLTDAMAYAALYPQNAKIVRSATSPPQGYENERGQFIPTNPRVGGKVWALSYVGKKEQQEMLTVITNAVNMQNSAFDTVTTEAAQKPTNQTKVNDPAGPARSKSKYTVKEGDWLSKIAIRNDTTVEALLALEANAQYRENPDLIEPGQIVTLPYNEANSRLPEIIPVMSKDRIDTILQATGQSTGSIPEGLQQIKPELSEQASLVDPDVDQDNWLNNVPNQPSGPEAGLNVTTAFRVPEQTDPSLSKTYYNQREKTYYHVVRTLCKNPKSYDATQGSEASSNLSDASLAAKTQILKFARKHSSDNIGTIADERGDFDRGIVTETKYSEPGRPMPTPAGQGYWLLSTVIPKKVIDEMPKGESLEDNSISTLARAKLLLAERGDPTAPGLRRTPLTVKVLKENIKNTRFMLKEYHTKLGQENITPSMMGGVNLDVEAERLGNFFERLVKYANLFNLSLEDDDRLELIFDASFNPVSAYHNGAEYTLDQVPKFYLKLAFGDVSPSTMALIFYSPSISSLKNVKIGDLPPATDFVQKYIYPSPVIKPTEIESKIKENEKSNKFPEDPEGASLGRNSFEKGPKKAKSSPTPKTKAEVEKQFQERYNFGRDMIGGYVNILNKAGCETPLAKYLEDAFMIYQLVGGKSSFKQIIGVVIKLLKDELMICKQDEQLLLQGAGYLDNPSQVTRDIEKELNRQFYNCFKVLGDVILKEVLPPVPPEVSQLIKKGLTPPRGIKLGKTPTTDLFALWRKQLLKLIIEFIKQLILEAMKEVLLAMAGCGPETVVDRNVINKNKGPSSPYGIIRINDIVDYTGVDLLEVAEELQIHNIKYVNQELITSPATLEQLRQLNDDASDMMTDRDVTAILQGSGGTVLINSLNRGFNLGPVAMNELSQADKDKITNGEYSEAISRALVGSVQESLNVGDTRYGTLNMSKENITKYFRRLGQLVGADISLGLEKPLDTKEAYCDERDILAYGMGAGLDIGLEDLSGASDSTTVAGGLSKAQLQREIDQCIRFNTFKIGNLCELASLNFDFASEIQAFWDLIGLPDWWKDFLRKISEASRKAQRIQALSITAGARAQGSEDTVIVNNPARSEIYKFYKYYYGDVSDPVGIHVQRSLKIVDRPVGNIPGNHPHYIYGYTDTTVGYQPSGSGPPNDMSFGMLKLDYIPRGDTDEKVRVYFSKRKYKTVAPNQIDGNLIITSSQLAGGPYPYGFSDTLPAAEELVAEFSLVDDNTPSGEEDAGRRQYSILAAVSDIPLSDPEYMSGENGESILNTINSINQNLLHINAGMQVGERDDLGGHGGTKQVARAIAALPANRGRSATYVDYSAVASQYINGYYNVARSVAYNLYGNASKNVVDRVDGTISRASVPPFGPNGDPCNFGKDEQRALATLNSINQRIFSFVLNTAPLYNMGFPAATPDTLSMLAAYLQHKIISDFERKGNLGIVLTGVDFVARTCSTTEPPDGEVEFNPALLQDPKERLEYIVKQMLIQVLFNTSKDGKDYITDDSFTGWGTLSENMFESINTGGGTGSKYGLNDSQRYGMLTSYFHNGQNLGRTGNATYNLPSYLRTAGLEDLPGIRDNVREFRYEQFLGLVPVPLLTGLNFIYYDKVVNVVGKFPTMAYYATKRLEDADNALRSLIQEESTPILEIPDINLVGPPTISDIIAKDERLRLERLAAKKAQLIAQEEDDDDDNGLPAPPPVVPMQVVTPEERDEANRRGGEEGGQEQQREELVERFPRSFGGKAYNNENELVRDKRKYEDLLERANTLRSHKTALETRLRRFGNEVARSEAAHGNDYDYFIRVSGETNTAFRGRIHEFVLNINRGSTLGITQYGTNRTNGGGDNDQRRYNNSTDLRVTNKDRITPTDLTTSRRFHPTNPPVRAEALRNFSLSPLLAMLHAGLESNTGGLGDRFESTAFYTHLLNAANEAFGLRARGTAEHDADFTIFSNAASAARNNTVIGILCLISYTVAQLDEAALFRDLRINAWDPEQRTRVTGIIQEMTNFLSEE